MTGNPQAFQPKPLPHSTISHAAHARAAFGRERQDPWLLIAEGFHSRGGMDKANAALANYLVSQGMPVHL
ncbi:MAG: hypothetical protein JO071_08570, partial [Deltaproteobacteria bacterium]|nr:hypothetical protein [Deltaproteobacteria bacterium]